MQELGIKIKQYTLGSHLYSKESKQNHVTITTTTYQEGKLLRRLKATGLMVKIKFSSLPEEVPKSPRAHQKHTVHSQQETVEMKGNIM